MNLHEDISRLKELMGLEDNNLIMSFMRRANDVNNLILRKLNTLMSMHDFNATDLKNEQIIDIIKYYVIEKIYYQHFETLDDEGDEWRQIYEIISFYVEKRIDFFIKKIENDTLENYLKDNSDTVLINSNFNCGYYVNREKLYNILKYKYGINSNYDPCSYPGIQCKFYYNPDVENQIGSQISEEDKKKFKNMKQVSFMIFRTGSVLIVGKCDESVLYCIYDFLKKLLETEYPIIGNEKNIGTVKKNNIKFLLLFIIFFLSFSSYHIFIFSSKLNSFTTSTIVFQS